MHRVFVAIVLGVLLVALPARASEDADPVWVTPGWAGYVLQSSRSFTGIRGTWKQPRVTCNRPGSSVSLWVGLGGGRRGSRSIEQLGTSADCDGLGTLSTATWYELFPSPPVDIPVPVRAGDVVSAAVEVTGQTVTLALTNVSTGASFSVRRRMRAPETDSAEWITEAPAACLPACTSLPLADFSTVRFRQGWARIDGHSGEIGDRAWRRLRLRMGALAGATPLSGGGSSFAVIRRTL
jgi:hypothetical protein